jgi:hypothetical protein
MTQTLPAPITAAMVTRINANEPKPRYSQVADWSGAAYGDDADQATANVALARRDGGADDANYGPRTQGAKATALGTTIAVDVARPRGWIAPGQPYQGNAAVPAAPVIDSISPTTGAAAVLPLLVTITGTGFTPFSVVKTGGVNLPEASAKYVDSTHMTVPVWKASAGSVGIVVQDHDVDSNSVNFTVT